MSTGLILSSAGRAFGWDTGERSTMASRLISRSPWLASNCLRPNGRSTRSSLRRSGTGTAGAEIAVALGLGNGVGGDGIGGDELAPFLVPEEETLLAVSVVLFRDKHGAANVEPEYVVSGFGHRRAGPIGEEIIGVQVVVAEELVGRAMEIMRAGLDRHVDRAGRADPEIAGSVAG